MAFGNNRGGKQSRSHFQQVGGSIIKFRHPYLAGQIEAGSNGAIDEIDISACCKLEGRFFEANQNQDSAKQVVLVDSSVTTITNKLLNGTITIPAVRTTGVVATGDFIAACQLIRSTGDTVGGLLYKTDFVDGKAITKLYYGVTVQRCPDDVSEGNDVGVYNIQLLYAGWIEAVSSSVAENKKKIWAVGTKSGLDAYFAPYAMQNVDGNSGTGETISKAANYGDLADDNSGDDDTTDGIAEKKFLDEAKSDAGWKSGIVKKATQLTYAAPTNSTTPTGETPSGA
nr:MAG TPA: hypothetical protein [Caudoviricetes sp.]